jgi:DNA-directed RNA polymerase specialized sigma24 family protein
MKNKEENKNYVDNEVFYNLLAENSKIQRIIDIGLPKKDLEILEIKQSKIKNDLGRIFIRICRGYISRPNFINYTIDRKQEMISDACFYMTKYMYNFNEEKTNPFSYFTRICHNAFLQYINKQNLMDGKLQSIGYIENYFITNNLKHDEDVD